MKKLLYIRQGGKHVITGGVKVNNLILEVLMKVKDVEVTILEDNYFWPNSSDIKIPIFVKSLMFNLKYAQRLDNILKYDFIFVDSRLFPRMFMFLRKVKKRNENIKIIAAHHHFCHLQQQNSLKKIIYKIVEMDFMRSVDKILVFSKYTYNTAINVGIEKEKLTFQELGFDRDENEEITNSKAKKDLLFIGTVESRKGLEYLVKAINSIHNKHRDIKVHIVGQYNLKSKYYIKLRKLINKYSLNENFIFHGRLSDEDVLSLKNQSAFFVFPSLYEGFGMVMAESMFLGLPVVSFNNSAMPYLVQDGYNGLIAKNKDSIDFGNKIEILINNHELRNKLSNGAIKTASSLNSTADFLFGIKNILDEYIN